MSNIEIGEYIKESLKIKGSVDVKKSTAIKLKELEKKGVQVNLLLAGILDGLEYEELISSVSSEDDEGLSRE